MGLARQAHDVNHEAIADALAEFGGTAAERRTVARQAADLADSGKHLADRGHPLSIEEILENLRDAPDDRPADRWNWWMGALDVAYGGYERFQVRRFPDE